MTEQEQPAPSDDPGLDDIVEAPNQSPVEADDDEGVGEPVKNDEVAEA